MLYLVLFTLWIDVALAQCNLNSPVPIPPESNQSLAIAVSNLTNSELGVNQNICAIFVELEHGRLENLRFILTSPSGQSVTLVGPGTTTGAFTSIINWNVSFLPCTSPVAPDAGISNIWSNDEPWAAFTNYTGSYYPQQGCLDEFTGTANGEWTLELINLGANEGNLIYFEILFCIPTGLECRFCNPQSGSFQEQFLLACEGIPSFNLAAPVFDSPPILQSFEFDTLVVSDGRTLDFVADFNRLDTLEVGEYEICSLVADTSLRETIGILGNLTDLIDFTTRNSCSSLSPACMTIEIQAVDNISEIDTFVCAGDSIEIMGQFYDRAVDTMIFNFLPQAPGCVSATALQIELIEYEVELETVPDPIFCGQDIVISTDVVTVPGRNTSYNWFRADQPLSNAGPLLSVSEAGTYSLEVSVATCTISDTVVLADNSMVDLAIAVAPRDCARDSFSISVTQLNGPMGLDRMITELLGPSGTLDPPTDSGDFSLFEKGEYSLTSRIGTCISTDSFVLDDNLQIWSLSAIAPDTIGCNGLPVSIIIDTDAIGPRFSYSGPEAIAADVTMPEVSTPGIYTITVTDENLCTETTTIEVIATADRPEITIADVNQLCTDRQPVMLTASVSGSVDSLRWIDADGRVYEGLTEEVTEPGTYVLTAFGPQGCNSIDSLVYSIDNTPGFVGVTNLDLACSEDSLVLVNNLGLVPESIQWSMDDLVISMDETVTVSQPGTYTLEVTDINGCTGVEEFILTQAMVDPAFADIALLQSSRSCLQLQELELQGELALIAELIIDGVTTPVSSILFLELGNHSVELVSEEGCSRQFDVLVESATPPTLDLGTDVSLAPGESYQVPGTSDVVNSQNLQFNWVSAADLSCIDCLDPIITAFNSQWTSLAIIDENGCEAIDSFFITIMPPDTPNDNELGIYLPQVFDLNAFAPDNEWVIGIDDSQYSDFELLVYDRWGNLVANNSGPITSSSLTLWDGTRNGKEVLGGVYVYMAIFLHTTGEEIVLIDHLTLLK